MPTNNSWNSQDPAQVTKGGTGAATLTGVLTGNGTSAVTGSAVTQYGVLVGGASNAVDSTAVGSAGEVLTSNGAGMAPTYQTVSTTDLHTAQFIVSAGGSSDGANYTTIASALTAASSGDTIFIQPGTYTEDLTLKAGVTIAAYDADALTPTVTILGKATATFAGEVALSGIRFETNSDYVLAITGSNATYVNLKDCHINATDASAFNVTSAPSKLRLLTCRGDLGTTGIAYFVYTAGQLSVRFCTLNNSGSSTTASTFQTGTTVVAITNSQITNSITTAGNAIFQTTYSQYTGVCTFNGINTHTAQFCFFNGSTSSAISVGGSAQLKIEECNVSTTNTNAITGAGTLNSGILSLDASDVINTTTRSYFYSDLGKYKAPGQPAFRATFAAGASNVTGDSTAYHVPWSATSFDQGGDFTTGASALFTAPVAGIYSFSSHLSLTGLATGNTIQFSLVTTGGTYGLARYTGLAGIQIINGTTQISMAAMDTAYIEVTVSGGTKIVGVQGSAVNSSFSGYQFA